MREIQQFAVGTELEDLYEIKDQEDCRQEGVVDAIFQKGFACGGQKPKMPGKKDEGRDIPAHDEDACGQAYDGGAHGTHVSKIFGGNEKRIGAIGPHEPSVQGAEKDQPEDQQYLEFFYV
jgi:hypothetical protein